MSNQVTMGERPEEGHTAQTQRVTDSRRAELKGFSLRVASLASGKFPGRATLRWGV